MRIADLARKMIRLAGRQRYRNFIYGFTAEEKLIEEVLNDAERVLPTHYPIARVRRCDYA